MVKQRMEFSSDSEQHHLYDSPKVLYQAQALPESSLRPEHEE
jgi:hypothetical protein